MTARPAALRTVRRALGVWSITLLVLLAVTYREVAPGDGGPVVEPRAPIVATADLPDGPGTTQPGLLLVAAVLPDGSLDIAEFARFVSPVASIDVHVPEVSRAGSMFEEAQPTITGLQISTGSRSVEVGDGSRSIDVAAGTTRAELRYQVTGITKRTEPSSAGRALAAVAPILAEQPDDFPVAFIVTGSGVRNLTCPDRPLPEQACATGTPPILSANRDLLWPEALVVAQVDVRP